MTATGSVSASSSTVVGSATPRFKSSGPEFVGVVLACSVGTRLFPLTSAVKQPKHILPVAGVPAIQRLLDALEQHVKFQQCVVVIASDDAVTIPLLQQHYSIRSRSNVKSKETVNEPTVAPGASSATSGRLSSAAIIPTPHNPYFTLSVVRLPEDCSGSCRAVNYMESLDYIPSESHLVVFPGDLIVLDPAPLQNLVAGA